MNTNDAKEYLARREIPQLFEVRDGADMLFSTKHDGCLKQCALESQSRSHGSHFTDENIN